MVGVLLVKSILYSYKEPRKALEAATSSAFGSDPVVCLCTDVAWKTLQYTSPFNRVCVYSTTQARHCTSLCKGGRPMSMTLPTISRGHTYVALATLLPRSLRPQASSAHLCFFQVVDHTTDAERMFVRVAALPHRLDDLDAPRVFTICLSDEQLAQALPWDRAMQARPTCDVRELVELHVKHAGDGIAPVSHAAPSVAAPVRSQEKKDIELVAVQEVFVSCETVQEVAVERQAPNG